MTLEGHRTDKAAKRKMTHLGPYSLVVGLIPGTSNRLSDQVPDRRRSHHSVGPGALNTTRTKVKHLFINFGTIYYMTNVLQ